MKRILGLLLAACLLLAIPAQALAAPSADVAPMDVQVWPGAEPGQLLVIVSTFLPEGTKLPATVRIPVVAGMKILWAGEIGGSGSNDRQVQPTIKKGAGGDYAEFQVTQFPQAQVEFGSVPLSQTAGGFSAEVGFVQTVPMESTSFSVRLPAGVSDVKIDPAPAGTPDRNNVGETLYTLPSKQLKAGDKQVVSIAYRTQSSQPSTASTTSRSTIMGLLLGLLAAAVVVLVVVLMRQRSSAPDAGDDDSEGEL